MRGQRIETCGVDCNKSTAHSLKIGYEKAGVSPLVRISTHNSEQAPRPLECVVEAGDVVYVPDGWYHAVVNLADTVAASRFGAGRGSLTAAGGGLILFPFVWVGGVGGLQFLRDSQNCFWGLIGTRFITHLCLWMCSRVLMLESIGRAMQFPLGAEADML